MKVAVVVLHGIGTPTPDFAAHLIVRVNKQLQRFGSNHLDVFWKPILWSSSLSVKESTLFDRMAQSGHLLYSGLRHFVMFALTDAVAYQKTSQSKQNTSMYDDIHDTIAREMHEFYDYLSANNCIPDGIPIVVVAHSLGCHVISNYIWDLQKGHRKLIAKSPLESFENLIGIFTLGCNIPLFSLAASTFRPIAFPHSNFLYAADPDVRERLICLANWRNYYSPFDALGYPLKTLGNEYDRVVNADYCVKVGNIFRRYTPFCHTEYLKSHRIACDISTMLCKLMA